MSKLQFAFAPFALLAVLSSACSAPSAEEDSSSENSASTTTPLGHYVLGAAGFGNDDSWLNEINLHRDGTFEGNFGNGASNLSGHFFYANGTYKVVKASGGSALQFSYSFDDRASTSQFLFKTTATGLQLQPDASAPWFSMDAAAAPITLNFAADGSFSAAGALHVGDTVLVRYAAARAKCGGANPRVNIFAALDFFPQPQIAAAPVEVDGYFDLLIPVGEGKNFALWFEDTNASGCSEWDSNASKNFNFAIE